MTDRGSGILLHITSLPSRFGIGDLGPSAYRFADFLAETKQSLWQILPLGPTDAACGHSPYASASAFAGSSLLTSPELLLDDGLVTREEIESAQIPLLPEADYAQAAAIKDHLLDIGYRRFKEETSKGEYERFREEHSQWLEPYAAFIAIKRHFGGKPWDQWPTGIRLRQREALKSIKRELADEIGREEFVQFQFLRQWAALKRYCGDKGIAIVGDVPIYVSYDSADAWSNPEIFKLDSAGRPTAMAGVPPDFFSKTGQLWGNPLYRWDVLKADGYSWWIARMAHALKLFDIVRIDHFRGFAAYWEVPAGEKTAVNGKWVQAPAVDFLETLSRHFPTLPVVAEDLGVITADVKEVMERFKLPGMKVLLFAFGEADPKHPYLPHNYRPNCMVYTGTHDNNTVRGWFDNEAKPDEKKRLFRYLGCEVPPEQLHWELIRLAMMSVADVVIVPMQDLLGLGEESRMNKPSLTDGNWGWRLLPDQLAAVDCGRLLGMTEIYGRARAGGLQA